MGLFSGNMQFWSWECIVLVVSFFVSPTLKLVVGEVIGSNLGFTLPLITKDVKNHYHAHLGFPGKGRSILSVCCLMGVT